MCFFFFFFFFKSYEITVYCFSSCLTYIVFNPILQKCIGNMSLWRGMVHGLQFYFTRGCVCVCVCVCRGGGVMGCNF